MPPYKVEKKEKRDVSPKKLNLQLPIPSFLQQYNTNTEDL
jgi:hypothetical protein